MRPIAIVCMLIQTPIALNGLGKEAFGFWVALTALFNTFAIADLGLGMSMQNAVSDALGRDDVASARRIFCSTFKVLVLIAGALLVVLGGAVWLVDWNALFSIQSDTLKSLSGNSVAVVSAGLCLNLPLAASQRLATGLQWSWLNSFSAAVASVLMLTGISLCALTGATILWYIASVALASVLVNATLLLHILKKLQWSIFAVTSPQTESRHLWHTSAMFFLPQLGSVLVFTAPSAIVAIAAGASAATPFSLAMRAASLALQFAGMALFPLWPAFAEAAARKDFDWIRSTYRLALGWTSLYAVVVFVGMVFFGKPLIEWWIRTDTGMPSQLLISTMAGWAALSSVGALHACLLNGLGRLKGQASYGFASACLSVWLIWILTPSMGAAGGALGLLIGYGLLNCPGFIVETRILLRSLPFRKPLVP